MDHSKVRLRLCILRLRLRPLVLHPPEARDVCHHIWIDSSYVGKANISELWEAINDSAMWRSATSASSSLMACMPTGESYYVVSDIFPVGCMGVLWTKDPLADVISRVKAIESVVLMHSRPWLNGQCRRVVPRAAAVHLVGRARVAGDARRGRGNISVESTYEAIVMLCARVPAMGRQGTSLGYHAPPARMTIFSFRHILRPKGCDNTMRLLDTWTGEFVEKDPRNPETKYAILSHTWDPEGEQTYQELRDIQKRYAPKRRPPYNPRGTQNDPSSSAERHEDVSSGAPSPAFRAHDVLPAALSTVQGVSSPTPSPSQRSTRAPSSASLQLIALVSASSPDAPPELSLLWDDPELSSKIRKACAVARAKGHRYIWIDSCCIDKTSSSELSEAINSMYQWYSRAVLCFAFLADVPAEEDHERKDSLFRRSRWFTRGWTLQELIAPVDVRFLSMEWTFIGSKHSLADLVAKITNISYNALLRVEPLKEFSVAQRLSWAAKRETIRLEDRAYSLLGIFDINMPTLYGEGHRAFRRLQEEIMRRIPDQTLFAWTSFSLDSPTEHHQPGSAICQCVWYSRDIPGLDHPSLFAPSLDVFRECGGIGPLPRDEVVHRLQHHLDLPVADYYSTPYGIRTQFPVIPFSAYFPHTLLVSHGANNIPSSRWYLAILECEHKDYPGHLLGRVCYTQLPGYAVEFSYCGYVEIGLPRTPSDSNRKFDLLPLASTSLKRLRSPQIKFNTVYIPHAQERDGASQAMRRTPHDTIKLVMLKKARDELHVKGYAVNLRGPDALHPTTHWLTLSHATHDIAIKFQHTLEGQSDNQTLTISSWVTVSAEGWGGSSTTDSLPWRETLLGTSGVGGDIPGVGKWSIWEELTLASKDHYAVHVELRSERSESSSRTLTPMAWRWWMRTCTGWFGRLATWVTHVTSKLPTGGRREARSGPPGGPYSELAEGA
ncbi:hypothetical protein LXA43DRAFT_1085497 [Ganoderma leucocontextum]|nr:hypothetical protein LXA43DRAFT_1085497 [Ganoderma leucocontextum]